jgi:2'-5' RNA ligase
MTRGLLHLTLVFLGATDGALVPDISAALAAVATRHEPYATRTGEAGATIDDRPSARRGGVAWLRLTDGGHETAQLAIDVDAALGSGAYDPNHAPRPHLTVARNVHQEEFAALREVGRRLELAWRTERVVLYRSFTSAHGSRYEELAGFPLTGTSGRA